MFKGITSIVLIVFFCFNLVPVVQCQTQEQEGKGKEIGYIKKFKKVQLDVLLFGVDESDYQSDLDNAIVSAGLRGEFKDENITLSEDATVSIQEKGNRWLIIDNHGKYLVLKEGDKLNIFKDVKEEKKEKVPLRVGDIITTLNSKAIIELKDCSSELEMGEETKVKVLGIRRFEVFKTGKRSDLRVMEKEGTCPPIEIVAEYVELHSVGTDFLVSVQGSEVKWAVVEGKVNVKARDETECPFTPQLYTGKTMTTVSEDRQLELEYLPKTSKAWKWGMLGGSAVGLSGLAYVVYRFSRIRRSSDDILKSSGDIIETVRENEWSDLGGDAKQIKDDARIIMDSLDKIASLSTGANEASTGEAPAGTAGIPCEDILAATKRIYKVADEISEGAKVIDKRAGVIGEAAEVVDKNSKKIRNIGKSSDFLATAAGIGVVTSIVLILLHDVYAGVDDSDTSLLVEPELNRQHAGIKLGVKQRF